MKSFLSGHCRLPSLIAAALLVGNTCGLSASVKVFLLGGQSNMLGRASSTSLPLSLQNPQSDVLFYYGSTLTTLRPGSGTDFGPEVTFGRTIADALPSQTFGLIKYAAGGTNLHTDWDPATGSNYTTFQNRVTNGLAALTSAGHTHEIVGMLWVQGESDAGRTAAEYEADLVEFVGDIRTRYGASLPFFLSRLSDGQTNISATNLAAIRTAQENFAASDPNAWMINSDGMGMKADNLHFDTAGQMALGEAFGQAYLAIPEPSPVLLVLIGAFGILHRRRA